MTRLSTHILDTARGVPAAGVLVSLFSGDLLVNTAVTDSDGRCHNLLQPGEELLSGSIYRLHFQVASYFPDGFYPEVSVTFRVSSGATHCHVPLLISPYGYTTYRGS